MYIYSICIKILKKLYNKLLNGNFKNKNYLLISCINTILNHNSFFFLIFLHQKYQFQIVLANPVHLRVYLNKAINRLSRRTLINSMYTAINNTTNELFSGQRSISPDLQSVSFFVQVPASSDGSVPTTWKQTTAVYSHTANSCLSNNFSFHANTFLRQ